MPMDVGDDYRVLPGCALPPKVAGAPRGAVVLSVPHILPSSAAEAVAENAGASATRLPRSALVRMRWWGEDRPGSSLFRPTRIDREKGESKRAAGDESDESDDDELDAGDSSLRMRYPVCAPLQQLLDYLRDMREIVFDVIDRDSRKKVGRSIFAFALPPGDSDERDVIDTLRRTNVLCEIYSTAATKELLGYLTVNMEVEWFESSTASTPLKWANSSAAVPTVSVNPSVTIGLPGKEPERNVQKRLSFSSISSSSTESLMPRREMRREGEDAAEHSTPNANVVTSRLEQVLEKGRALQHSMTAAITEEVVAPESAVDSVAAGSLSPTSMKVLMAPYEAITADVDNSWEQVLEEVEQSRPSPSVQTASSTRETIQTPEVSLGEFNALELSFESMELEQEMIDRLRQLREGSVSTRFSPIQLVVSHEHPRVLFHKSMNRDADRWIAAFAVNSSLRKRQWRTSYSHTLPLEVAGGVSRLQLQQHALRFRVRCKPQHASPPSRRRREPSQTIDLISEIPAEELFENRDCECVVNLPLRLESSASKTAKVTKPPKVESPVGKITLRLRFAISRSHTPPTGDREVNNVSKSSVGSDPDENTLGSKHHSREDDRGDLSETYQPTRSFARTLDLLIDVPLFLGLLIGRALVRNPHAVNTGASSPVNRPRFTLRVDYGTPSFFRKSPSTLQLRRSAKASLRALEQDWLRASFGHMNVFPVEVSRMFVEKLERGLLILEVWIQEHSTALPTHNTEKLLGIVKIPLHVFKNSIRNVETIVGYLSHDVPFVGVDEDFPIVDPLYDHVNGQVHVRMAFGSAEQLFNLKSTLTAVVKLQSLVRGWVTRRALRYWKQLELKDIDHERNERPTAGSGAAREDFVKRSAPSRATAIKPSGGVDVHQSSMRVENVITRLEVRVEVLRHYPKGESSAIGCEVHGHLRFQDPLSSSAVLSASGPRFTLWWDSQDDQLNSYFYHSIQASDLKRGIDLHDIVLLLRVDPQYPTTRRINNEEINVQGVSALELHSVLAHSRANPDLEWQSDVVSLEEDLNVPIVWNSASPIDQSLTLPLTLPLRLRLKLLRESKSVVGPEATSRTDEILPHVKRLDQDEFTTVKSLSRTERLLPASLRLCLDLQRIVDLRDIIREHLASIRRQADQSRTTGIQASSFECGSVTIDFSFSICLGTEIHPEERRHGKQFDLFQDEHSRWHKRFRFEAVSLVNDNGVQALPSITQGDTLVIVHHDLVTYLQESNLEVSLFVNDGHFPSQVGTVSVPMSAVLFRPTGVQGSFPVKTGEALVGRLGVHLYIEHDNELIIREAEKLQACEGAEIDNDTQSSLADEALAPNVSDGAVPQELSPIIHDAEDYLLPKEQLEDTVESLKVSTMGIQERLTRLAERTSSSHRSTSLNSSSTPDVSSACSKEHSVQDTTELTTVTSIHGSPQRSQKSECDDNSGDFVGSPEINGGTSIGQAQSSSIILEEVEVEEDAFRPITLASLGIEELDFSPESSPTFGAKENRLSQNDEEAEALDTERANMPNDASDDLDVLRAIDPVTNENEEASENGKMSMDAISTTSGHETPEPVEAGIGEIQVLRPSEVNNDVDNIELLDGGELVACGEGSQTGSVNTVDIPLTLLCPPVQSRVELVITDGVTNHSPHEGDLTETNDRVMSSDVALDASHGGEGGEPREMADLDVESEDARPSQTERLEHGAAHASNDGLEFTERESHTVTLVHTSPELEDPIDVEDLLDARGASPTNSVQTEKDDSSNDLIGDSEQTQSPEVPVRIEAVPSPLSDALPVCALPIADHQDSSQDETSDGLNRTQFRIRCDAFTQTEDEFPIQPTEAAVPNGMPFLMHEKRISLETADSACQTLTESMVDTTQESATESNEICVPTENVDITERANRMAHGGVCVEKQDDAITRETDAADHNDVLPIEKFNIAWQLLNEIKGLYAAKDQSNACEMPLTRETEERSSLVSPSIGRHEAHRLMSNHDTQEANIIVGDKDYAVNSFAPLESTSASTPMGAWKWDDESTLMAQMDKRLSHSKQEYEDALALSQSACSVSSNGSSFAHRLGRSMTAEQEEKALELSASARAKQSRSRLARLDTETERIARIMQGNLRNLLGEDHEDDETSDNDDESDDSYF